MKTPEVHERMIGEYGPNKITKVFDSRVQRRIDQDKERIKEYLTQNPVAIQTTSGLVFHRLTETVMEMPQERSRVMFRYIVRMLFNGEEVDNTMDESPPIMANLNELDLGVREGLSMMRVGERAKFLIPPHLLHRVNPADKQR